jgi:hypothetical protein
MLSVLNAVAVMASHPLVGLDHWAAYRVSPLERIWVPKLKQSLLASQIVWVRGASIESEGLAVSDWVDVVEDVVHAPSNNDAAAMTATTRATGRMTTY